MKNLISKVKLFCNKEEGVITMEYAVIFAGIAVIAIALVSTNGPLRQALLNIFTELQNTLNTLWDN
jgi:Flp pilus assembly pilin Flp